MKFVKKFKSKDGWLKTHTYRELVLGAHLCSSDHQARYEMKLDSQKPDWSIFGYDEKIKAIVELTSFHSPKVIEDGFENSLNSKGSWFGWHSNNADRLYHSIQDKIIDYKNLVVKYELAFVVAVFSQPPADIQIAELRECLFDKSTGLFKDYPELSGVLLFKEGAGNYFPQNYYFEYIENPEPLREFKLP